jgi:hypothetical protein
MDAMLQQLMTWVLLVSALACQVPADEGDPPPAPAPVPVAPAAADAFPRAVSHKPYTDALRAFCDERKITVTEQGGPLVKLLLIGGAQVPNPGAILQLAQQTLDGYEIWSGQQEIFARRKPVADETYHLVVFKNDADYSALIDYLRAHSLMPAPDGEDLAKKVSGFPRPRVMFSKNALISIFPDNWAIYSTSCLALDAFYLRYSDKRGPAWIREGMAAEMQRLQCKGQIRCTTIAYEENKESPVDNWPRDVATMINRHDAKLISASDAMHRALGSLAGVNYRQMWSLLAYVRQNCGTKKGPDNKFYRLLLTTAEGTDSESAVKSVLGASDPALTDAWWTWARDAK